VPPYTGAPALLEALALLAPLVLLVLLQAASEAAASIATAIAAILIRGRLIRPAPFGPAESVYAARATALCHQVYWS
jgi:hypothetical protein